MKPKPLSNTTTRVLSLGASTAGIVLSSRQCRDVLAALEYERQKAESLLDAIAAHASAFGGTPRGEEMDVLLVRHGRKRAALTFGEQTRVERGEETLEALTERMRIETAAVVPKPKKR